MKISLQDKCDLFTDNYYELMKKFKWNYTMNSRLGALLYTMDNRRVDIEGINRCRKVIKENTGVFSQFKDTTNFMTSVMLSLQPEPEAVLKGALNVYDTLKKEGFHASPYLVLAAVSVVLQADPYNYNKIIVSTKEYYDAMKVEHKLLTSADDYGFAALLAMTDKPVFQTIKEMEQCYINLKDSFSNHNSVQTLCQILTFSEDDPFVKCQRVVELHGALKKNKCKVGSGIELSFLGVIALLKEDSNKLADEILEVNEYLKDKKGFGNWSLTNAQRVMFALSIVCDDYLTDARKSTMEMALVNNITGILLAQQMATMAAASGAAAASASSAY